MGRLRQRGSPCVLACSLVEGRFIAVGQLTVFVVRTSFHGSLHFMQYKTTEERVECVCVGGECLPTLTFRKERVIKKKHGGKGCLRGFASLPEKKGLFLPWNN